MGVGDIATGVSEDFVDELSEGIVYKYFNYAFAGFDPKLLEEGDDAIFAEALEGAYSVLQYSIISSVIGVVSTLFIPKLVIMSGAIYTYIKTSRAINRARRALVGIPYVGRSAVAIGAFASRLALGNQDERLAMAGMANDNGNNLISAIGQERQNQIIKTGDKRKHVNDTLKNSSFSKSTKI